MIPGVIVLGTMIWLSAERYLRDRVRRRHGTERVPRMTSLSVGRQDFPWHWIVL